MIDTSVDLPAPLPPISATASPAPTAIDTLVERRTPPKDFVSPRASRTGSRRGSWSPSRAATRWRSTISTTASRITTPRTKLT
jgi:hypothetical protein